MFSSKIKATFNNSEYVRRSYLKRESLEPEKNSPENITRELFIYVIEFPKGTNRNIYFKQSLNFLPFHGLKFLIIVAFLPTQPES